MVAGDNVVAGSSLLGLATPIRPLPPDILLRNPTRSLEKNCGTRSQLAEGCHRRFHAAVGAPALCSFAASSLLTLKFVGQCRHQRSRTRKPFSLLCASNVDEQSPTPGRLSGFLARFRSGKLQQLEQELTEARALILQAEKRAELLQSQFEGKLQEDDELKNELNKQITSLKEAYGELSDRLEHQEAEASVKLEEAALQLSASQQEQEAMLKRLQRAEKNEKQMEKEQKKLLEQLSLASGKEQSLQSALKQTETELAEVGAQRDQLQASEADARQELNDVKLKLQQLTVPLDDLKDEESSEEDLSAQLAQAQAGNKKRQGEEGNGKKSGKTNVKETKKKSGKKNVKETKGAGSAAGNAAGNAAGSATGSTAGSAGQQATQPVAEKPGRNRQRPRQGTTSTKGRGNGNKNGKGKGRGDRSD